RRRPSGEKRGPASPRERATIAAVTAGGSGVPSMEGGRYRRSKVVSPSRPPTPTAGGPSMAKAQELPDRNLGMELVRVPEAAAMAGARWMGRGDKEAADGAAVDAMRAVLSGVSMD